MNGATGSAAMEVCEELAFHGIEYILSVSVADGQVLHVDVEKKEDGERWHGEFSASYIEEVTQKTGNFKKFSVFVKMLCTSLTRDQRSETVFADLLTYSDLEMLRSRQTRKPVNTAARPNNKRYLILTYAVEFDRVHYPLPLAHVDEPPVHALNATIRRLREEIKQLQASGHSRGHPPESGADEVKLNAKLLKDKDQALKELDKMRTEVARLTRANDQLAADLERQNGNSFERETHSKQLREARRRVTELENELANEHEEARAEQEELRRQLVILQREVDAGKQTILDLKSKVREVSQNSDVAVRRAKLEADSRLDHKRAIYGASPNSRPSSAERRRTSPSPSRPFQRFDPTAYVKEKEKTQRARSSSPRPPQPSSAGGAGSRTRSRPSSAERQRPLSSGPGAPPSAAAAAARGRSRPSSAGGSAANSVSSSRPSSVERPRRPSSTERQRPWAELPKRSYSPSGANNVRPSAQPSSRTSSRPASAERQRPGEDNFRARTAGSPQTRAGERDRERQWSTNDRSRSPGLAASPSSGRADYGAGVYRKPLADPSRNRGPPSTESSPGHKYRNGDHRNPGEGRRVERGRGDDEENQYPRGQHQKGESGDEISDIDARLNALQSFLQTAKAKAKAAGANRGR